MKACIEGQYILLSSSYRWSTIRSLMVKPPADDSAPVTKGDLKKFLEESRRSMDEKITAEGEKTRHHFDVEGEKTRRHFDVVAEDLTHDFQGIFKDRTSQHTDDIQDLKRRTGRIERHLNLLPTA